MRLHISLNVASRNGHFFELRVCGLRPGLRIKRRDLHLLAQVSVTKAICFVSVYVQHAMSFGCNFWVASGFTKWAGYILSRQDTTVLGVLFYFHCGDGHGQLILFKMS